MSHFVFSILGNSIIPPLMSIFSFFLLHINFTNIITKLIDEFLNRRPEVNRTYVYLVIIHEFPVICVNNTRPPMNIIKRIYFICRICITSSSYPTNPFSNIHGMTNILSTFFYSLFLLFKCFCDPKILFTLF